MLEFVVEKLGLNLDESWLIGDNSSDVGAACQAQMTGTIHVETGHGRTHRAEALQYAHSCFEMLAMANIAAAIEILERY